MATITPNNRGERSFGDWEAIAVAATAQSFGATGTGIPIPRGIYMGSAGSLVLISQSGNTATFSGLLAGTIYPFMPATITTASTATAAVALF